MRTVTFDETKFRLIPVEPTDAMLKDLGLTTAWQFNDEGMCPERERIAKGYCRMVGSLPAIPCGTCDGSGSVDSGGVMPWGEAIFVACPECEYHRLSAATLNTEGLAPERPLYKARLKSRSVMEAERYRTPDIWGWWSDACPGAELTLRAATEADIKRCILREGSSLDPKDWLCERPADGALVSRQAIASLELVS